MIHKSIVVRVPPERAFESWHRNIHLWWPAAHRRSGDRGARMVFEPAPGGRFYERASDGDEHDWGRVLTFEPPTRLECSFFVGTGADHPTVVEVRFTAVEGGTRVDLAHRRGDSGDRFDRVAHRFHANWDEILAALGAHHAPA